MKVGTRMTIGTSVVVAIGLAIFVFLDLRTSQGTRAKGLEDRVRDVARALRTQLEASGVNAAIENGPELSEEMTRALEPYTVAILDARIGRGNPTDEQGKRMKALIEGRPRSLISRKDHQLVYALPLRAQTASALEGYQVLGSVEVSHSTSKLDAAYREDLIRTMALSFGIIALVVLAVLMLIRSLVTNPIAKLLTGVDDVAHGDLSRVLLSEREDEIGDLASRFNEMTYSLRESQNETERQNKARAAMEGRMFQNEKLATIGQIAAEIAHEVGTPLNVISGRARTMAKKSGDRAAVEKNATIIAEQSARITRIIQRLLDFSRRKVGAEDNTEAVNLNTLTLNTMEFLESKLGAAQVKHRLNRAEGLPPIKGNPDQVLQVLINLVLNAAEAMSEGGGQLDMETALVTRRRPGLEVAPEQSMVVVSVSDTGPGIPEGERDKIFEPFHSSKTKNGGTGLGLSVVHGIVKAHDGWIEVSDAPGGGTCFSVYFPVLEEDA